MIYLILGLAIWVGAHFFKRLMPDLRASLGDAGKGVVAVAIVISLVLIVIGYRSADFIPVWSPPSFFGHINNLLMLVAFYVYGAGAAKGAKVWLGTKLRHPQLTATAIWAGAHLLANGDLASILLFGVMLAWALVSIRLINAAEGPWETPAQAPFKKEIVHTAISLVLFVVVAGIHAWLGVSPFGGV